MPSSPLPRRPLQPAPPRPGHAAVLRVRPRPRRRAPAPLRPASRAPGLPRAAAGLGGQWCTKQLRILGRRETPSWASGVGGSRAASRAPRPACGALHRRRELSPWAHGLGGRRRASHGPACGAPCRARFPGPLRPPVPRSAPGRGLGRSVPRPLHRSPSRRRHDPLPQ
ncbi:hypothetical protein PVAP13_5KG301528 [Panicum virgatum]|uniref:Uncharacterized protein n=1 Tax=Panicum virgatum TaxID=38727 RepID=A0A8T0SEC9_PANVG|nr:hypothetical protein PVAP13_5KG301528 [Panicum virgatum]